LTVSTSRGVSNTIAGAEPSIATAVSASLRSPARSVARTSTLIAPSALSEETGVENAERPSSPGLAAGVSTAVQVAPPSIDHSSDAMPLASAASPAMIHGPRTGAPETGALSVIAGAPESATTMTGTDSKTSPSMVVTRSTVFLAEAPAPPSAVADTRMVAPSNEASAKGKAGSSEIERIGRPFHSAPSASPGARVARPSSSIRMSYR